MRRYDIEILYPWDEKWFSLKDANYRPLYFFRASARMECEAQRPLYGSATRFRIVNYKTKEVVWQDA